MTTAICDLSELPVDQCSCRIHAEPAPAREPVEVTTRFPARFNSHCDQCGSRMHEGDLIGRTVDGDYVCEGCSL